MRLNDKKLGARGKRKNYWREPLQEVCIRGDGAARITLQCGG